jgi:FkbM family methyltransferase
MEVDKARWMGAAIYWTGFHDLREFIFLHKFLKSSMTFIDIGANQGEYSLFAAKRLTSGKVLAFEPLPSILQVFRKNIELNGFGNIEVFPVGLSDTEGTFRIYDIGDDNEGLATIYPGERKSNSSFDVKLQTLDQIVSQSGVASVDFIKIDIEGGELKALQGSIATIGKFKPVLLVEVSEVTYKSAGYNVADVEAFFKRLNYESYAIGKRGRLVKCESLPVFGNIVFKPK